MLNNTRITHFNKLFSLIFRQISKNFYCFNEDSYNVQNFYYNDWEDLGDQVDPKTLVTVGVNI